MASIANEVSRFESLLAMSLGLWFDTSRKGGTGEVGGCTQWVLTAWLHLGLAVERLWLALDIALLLCINWLRKQSSALVGLTVIPFSQPALAIIGQEL